MIDKYWYSDHLIKLDDGVEHNGYIKDHFEELFPDANKMNISDFRNYALDHGLARITNYNNDHVDVQYDESFSKSKRRDLWKSVLNDVDSTGQCNKFNVSDTPDFNPNNKYLDVSFVTRDEIETKLEMMINSSIKEIRMKKRHIFSRFFMSESIEKKSLSEIAQDVAVFFFNMRTCHFKTSGKEFLELHEYAQELYEQAEEYYDDLIETAISYNEEVVPMCVVPDDWMPDYSVYDKSAQGTIDMMKDCVKILFDRLESLKDGYSSFVYSKRDTILEWLDKQNYKLEQMSAVI